MWLLSSEGKGSWIPDGWQIPIFLISISCVVITTLAIRKCNEKR